LQGIILDNNAIPIPYANIQLKNTSKGTISNKEGQFTISIPPKLINSKLVISCIGYNNTSHNIDTLRKIQKNSNAFLKLTLQNVNYKLDEILITKQKISKNPYLIFKKAVEKTKDLLAPKPHLGKFYFRQTHRDDSSMNRLIEAAISIYDPGVNQNIKECKFNIDQIHSSLDSRIIPHELNLQLYRNYAERKKSKHYSMAINPRIPTLEKNKPDTIWKNPKIQKALTKTFDNHYASLPCFFFKANMIRDIREGRRKRSLSINPKFNDGGPKITDSFIKEHILKLDTILLYNNEPIYKIKILPNKRYPGIEYQKSRYIPIGWAYIRVTDFAFLGLDYAYISNPKHKGFKYKNKYLKKFNGKFHYYFKYKIRLKEFKGKLYSYYLYYERSDYNNIPYANLLSSEFSEYLNIPTMYGRQICTQEMIATEIITDSIKVQTEYQKRKWKGDIYEKRPFSKEFLDNYSQIIPTHEEQLLKGKLLKEIQNKNKK
jgi:hypothetical protein